MTAQVVGGAVEVVHRPDGGEHRVVRVVVAMHAVAPDLLKIVDRLKPAPDLGHPPLVVGVVDGVGVGHAHHVAARHAGGVGQPDAPQLLGGQRARS